ncbi:MAG TPA: ATP-dependent sacrificial sulfur transferase LarE [Pyrinomonadaceae bacterium]|nr:ATP-dependent sacrificial sulfur transferase LarE [Pyrinomonadaceae bacterium]
MQNQVVTNLPELPSDLAHKYESLKSALQSVRRAVVAYSGGVDSTLVAKVARDVLGAENVLAVIAVSPSFGEDEERSAILTLAEIEVPYIKVETDEVDDPRYAANPANRCYFCKEHVYGALVEVAQARGFDVVTDGFNADDTGDFRPGRKAGRELGVRSPLNEAGLTKDEIRELARHLGLSNWSKPAMACLSSRVEYGTPITVQILTQVDRAEQALRRLGFDDLRIRHHDKVARIEVEPDAIDRALAHRTEIIEAVKATGYVYVTLDLEGLRHGSMNEGLTNRG